MAFLKKYTIKRKVVHKEYDTEWKKIAEVETKKEAIEVFNKKAKQGKNAKEKVRGYYNRNRKRKNRTKIVFGLFFDGKLIKKTEAV